MLIQAPGLADRRADGLHNGQDGHVNAVDVAETIAPLTSNTKIAASVHKVNRAKGVLNENAWVPFPAPHKFRRTA